MNRNGVLALAFNCGFVAFIAAPLLAVALVSFTTHDYISLPYDGLSLRWFAEVFHNSEFTESFFISLGLAALAASLSSALTVPAALAIARYQFRGRNLLIALLQSPLMVPAVVLGISFLSLLTLAGWNGTFAGFAICHVIIVMPYILRLAISAFVGLDRNLESAAISLGASSFTVFRRITLPLALPGIAAGWALAFITSFDDLTVSIFISSPSVTTLPVRLFARMTETIDPMVAAASTVLMLLAVGAMVLLDRIYGIDRIFASRARE